MDLNNNLPAMKSIIPSEHRATKYQCFNSHSKSFNSHKYKIIIEHNISGPQIIVYNIDLKGSSYETVRNCILLIKM